MLHSISTGYDFRTIELLKDRKANKADMVSGAKHIINLYHTRELKVTQIIDNEFECIREEIRPTILNTVAAEEQVGTVERSIRSVKKIDKMLRTKITLHTLSN